MKTQLVSFLLILASCLPALALTPAERATIWTRTHDAIRTHFTGFDTEERAAWDADFAPMLDRLTELNDETEFWRALRVKIASLGDGRTSIQLPNGLPRTYDTVPIRFVVADGRVLVKQLSSSPDVQQSGIKPGDELLTVDGKPVIEHLRSEVLQHVSASGESQRLAEAAWRVLLGDARQSAQLTLRKPDGREYSVTLRRDCGPDGTLLREFTMPSENMVRHFPGSVIYVEVGQRLMANTEEVILQQLDSNPKSEWLILDLRETKLGQLPRRVLQKLALFPLPAGAYREVAWHSISTPMDPATVTFEPEWRDVPAHMIESHAEPYRGKVVALVSAETAGPAEQFLEPLLFADRIVLIGDTTAGAGGEVFEFAFGRGAKLSVTVRQPTWESGYGNGLGFPPRIYVEPTAKGLASGKDEVLDRAISYINERAH